MKNTTKHPRAASLFFVTILITIMFITVAGVVDAIKRAGNNYEDQVRSGEAYDASASLKGKARREITANGLGYENPNGSDNILDRDSDGTFEIWGTYEVWARAKKIGWREGLENGDAYATYAGCGFSGSDLCSVPIPGTGNAGNSLSAPPSGCNFTNPTQAWASDIEDDCNWNTLRYGEVISIPLYYEVSDGSCLGNICNPAEAPTLGTFTLRVRTPNGETLNEAIDLNGDGDASDSGETDPVVVNWEITGDCDTDNDEVADESCWMIGKVADPSIQDFIDSFINASDVNDATAIENEVVDETYVGELWNGGTNISILDFLTTTEAGPAFLNLDFEILNPLLTISVVTPLENFATLNPVPYLEYQIQVDKPVSDTKSSIYAIGKAHRKNYTSAWPLLDYLGIDENPLIQFVIQN